MNINAYEASMDPNLRTYILIKDNDVRAEIKDWKENEFHELLHIWQEYKQRIDNFNLNITEQVYAQIDSELSSSSMFPVQNKVVTNKFNSLETTLNEHLHDSCYYTKEQIDTILTPINSSLNNKVDKIEGYGLSKNDFSDTYKSLLDNIVDIQAGNSTGVLGVKGDAESNFRSGFVTLTPNDLGISIPVTSNSLTTFVTSIINPLLNTKVTAVSGYGLSKNDFTDEYKTKVDNLTNPETSGTFIIDSELSITSWNALSNAIITSELNKKANLTGATFTGNVVFNTVPTTTAQITNAATDNSLVTKKYVDDKYVAQNSEIDDVYFITTPNANTDMSTYINDIFSKINNGRILVILKVFAQFTSFPGIDSNTQYLLYCPYVQTVNNTYYFGTYVPALDIYYTYSIDIDGGHPYAFKIPSTTDIALVGHPTTPTPDGTVAHQIVDLNYFQTKQNVAVYNLYDSEAVVYDSIKNQIQQEKKFIILQTSTVVYYYNQIINNKIRFLSFDSADSISYMDLYKDENDATQWTNEVIVNIAPLASPAFTGTPTVPTADISVNNTQAASTAYVQNVKSTLLNGGPEFTVSPLVPTCTLAETEDAKAASLGYVQDYVNNELSNFSTSPFIASSTAPLNQQLFWIDTSTGYRILKYYNGSAWVPITSVWTS